MPQAHIHFDFINGAGLVTLDRPEALNALTVEMVIDLRQVLLDWRDDSAISHVVIASSAPRAFCAGGDIRQARETIIANGLTRQMPFFGVNIWLIWPLLSLASRLSRFAMVLLWVAVLVLPNIAPISS